MCLLGRSEVSLKNLALNRACCLWAAGQVGSTAPPLACFPSLPAQAVPAASPSPLSTTSQEQGQTRSGRDRGSGPHLSGSVCGGERRRRRRSSPGS